MDEEQRISTLDIEQEVGAKPTDFALDMENIKLENLPRYEDLITPKVEKLENMQEVGETPFFATRKKVEKKDPNEEIQRKRFKIAVGTFAIVGVLMLAFVLINAVSLVFMHNDIKSNNDQINTLTQEVDVLSKEQHDLTNSTLQPDGADKISYKLALPRSYPDNTADLTWFDKLSIFLMKLFG